MPKGEVMVVNESPILKAGKRIVTDWVSKGKSVVMVVGEGVSVT
jgi:hypothetical protein